MRLDFVAFFSIVPSLIKTLLQIYRIGVLVAIAWLVRTHHDSVRIQGDWPVSTSEVKAFLPQAHRLRVDSGVRAGLEVLDASGAKIGYAVRTMPASKGITGYSGPTDALMVFDAEDKALGVAIRHSYDTPSHVADVKSDYIFMEKWNGRSWQEIAEISDLAAAGIYGVSGATRTSEAVAKSLSHRLASVEEGTQVGQKLEFSAPDAILLAYLVLGSLFAFWKKKSFQKWRWVFSLATVVGLGLWLGDLLAQSLLVGWVESRVPWEQMPGLVIFAIAAFSLPWVSGQPVYCQFICPHGNLQRWTMKWLPARWKKPMPEGVKWAAKWIAPSLLVIVLATSFLRLPLDLAGIEPFDAYLLKGAGVATIAVAIAGLLLSVYYPMFYCKYGCPTGWLLEFVRKRMGKDKFSARDWFGLFLLAVAAALHWMPVDWILG